VLSHAPRQASVSLIFDVRQKKQSPTATNNPNPMKVFIKEFAVEMEVKSSGIEFEVRTPDNKTQLGDCYLTMAGLTWCEGKTGRDNGLRISWDSFIQIMKSEESLNAAVKAARKTE
jgi:hypothetical protein